jgi:hypothetical protein
MLPLMAECLLVRIVFGAIVDDEDFEMWIVEMSQRFQRRVNRL